MRSHRNLVIGAMLLAVALVAAACSSGGDTKDGTPIIIGSANFGESALVAEIYAQALEAEGYTVVRKLNTGNREIYATALEAGELHLVPEYVGSALSFKGGVPTANTDSTTSDLRAAWAIDGVTVLNPALAQDKNGFVVTAATAADLGLSSVSDLAAFNGTLVFGGPPECPEREFCLPGLESVYGLSFAEFKALDVGGPLTVAALEGDEIQLALLFTSDGVIASKGFVLLDDDKGLQPAENVVPVVLTSIVDEYGTSFTDVLNKVSAKLTTADLTLMNKLTGYDGEDPVQVAADWLKSVGITK